MILLHDLSESVFGKWKELFEGFWTGWIGVLCSDKSCYHALISVRYGAGRGGFSLPRPRPYTGPGGVCFGLSPPCPRQGPTRTHSLDGAPFVTTYF